MLSATKVCIPAVRAARAHFRLTSALTVRHINTNANNNGNQNQNQGKVDFSNFTGAQKGAQMSNHANFTGAQGQPDHSNFTGANGNPMANHNTYNGPMTAGALMHDASIKHSQASKTGDVQLEMEARAEQSLADRLNPSNTQRSQQRPSPQNIQGIQRGDVQHLAQEIAQGGGLNLGGLNNQGVQNKTNINQSNQHNNGQDGQNQDAYALKMDAAQKQSQADKTGDMNLMNEARREHSMADRMVPGRGQPLYGNGPSGQVHNNNNNRNNNTGNNNNNNVNQSDSYALKMDAAQKQSQADKSGDMNLMNEARREHSMADRMVPGRGQPLYGNGPSGQIHNNNNNIQNSSNSNNNYANNLNANSNDLGGNQFDSFALKMDAAQKQSQADKTGDVNLMNEARREHSMADRMVPGRGQPLYGQGPSGQIHNNSNNRNNNTNNNQNNTNNNDLSYNQGQQGNYDLKMDAAQKQSEADRTGDSALRAEAQREQSMADRTAPGRGQPLYGNGPSGQVRNTTSSGNNNNSNNSNSNNNDKDPDALMDALTKEDAADMQGRREYSNFDELAGREGTSELNLSQDQPMQSNNNNQRM